MKNEKENASTNHQHARAHTSVQSRGAHKRSLAQTKRRKQLMYI